MLFGNNPSKDVTLDQLEAELDSLFDKKSERFTSRASKILSEIAGIKKGFIAACDEFDRIEAKPDIEFKMWLNPGFIKSQKGAYAAALKRIFSSSAVPSGKVSYLRYSSELAMLNSMMNEVLAINGRNRDLVNSYSRHMGRFKSLQGSLEGNISALRAELGKVSIEFNEYNSTLAEIEKLRSACDEIDALRAELDLLESASQGKATDAKEGMELIEPQAAKRRSELAALRDESERISTRVSSLVIPLGKAARIYDHFAMRKIKLAEIIENPVKSLSTQESFFEFGKMLQELKESVEKGRTQLKKPEETVSLISKISEAKLYEDLKKKAMLDQEIAALEDEIRFYDGEVSRIENAARDKGARLKRLEELGVSIKELEAKRGSCKEVIEQLVSKYYKKKVSIVL